VDADATDRRALVATRQDQPSLAAASLSRQTPEVGAECVSSARSDLSGGCRVKPASLRDVRKALILLDFDLKPSMRAANPAVPAPMMATSSCLVIDSSGSTGQEVTPAPSVPAPSHPADTTSLRETTACKQSFRLKPRTRLAADSAAPPTE